MDSENKSTLKNWVFGFWLFGTLVGVTLVGIFFTERFSFAGVLNDRPVAATERFRNFTFFASSTAQIDLGLNVGTTTNATSTDIVSYFDTNNFKDNGYFVIAGAKRITMFFSRDDTNRIGTTTFSVQVTPDGITWLDYNKLISNVTNSISQNLTRVRFATMSGSLDLNQGLNATTTYSLDPDDSWYGVRCVVVEATDGIHYCSATADW